MAQMAFTAGNVLPGISCTIDDQHLAGAAITIGSACRLDASGLWQLASASAVQTCSGQLGIAMSQTQAPNGPIYVATLGSVIFGSVTGVSRQGILVCSPVRSGFTAGGICLNTDLTTGEFLAQLGFWTGDGTGTGIVNGLLLNTVPTGIPQ